MSADCIATKIAPRCLTDRYDCRTLMYEYDDVIARRPQQTMLARAPAPQFAVLNGLLYIALIVLGDAAGIFDVEAKESVIGFSGVIFSMLVIYVYNFTYSENIRLYAMISAPTPVVPWLLFVLFMMVLPVEYIPVPIVIYTCMLGPLGVVGSIRDCVLVCFFVEDKDDSAQH